MPNRGPRCRARLRRERCRAPTCCRPRPALKLRHVPDNVHALRHAGPRASSLQRHARPALRVRRLRGQRTLARMQRRRACPRVRAEQPRGSRCLHCDLSMGRTRVSRAARSYPAVHCEGSRERGSHLALPTFSCVPVPVPIPVPVPAVLAPASLPTAAAAAADRGGRKSSCSAAQGCVGR